jgi:hypothetical protein
MLLVHKLHELLGDGGTIESKMKSSEVGNGDMPTI